MTHRPLSRIFAAIVSGCLAIGSQPAPAQPAAVANPGANAQPAAAAMVPVAILPFQERGAAARLGAPGVPGAADDAGKVTDLLFAALVAEPGLVLIEREDIHRLLDEQTLNLTGLANPAEAVRVGQLTGARILITGSVLRADNAVYLVAKIIGTETSRVLGASVKGTARDDLGKLSEGLAAEVMKVVIERGGELLPKVVVREDRLAALKRDLPAGARPALLIEITEQHLGTGAVIAGAAKAAAIDPSAETEMALFAKETGFEVIDAREGNRSNAAVILQGEAISEPAVRHGNLVSAKARLEVKAIDQATGKVLAIDRQTTVATDLTELIAAKTALQVAAASVAERLLPKIARLNLAEAGK